jgi:hypothetical protein
VCVSPFTSNAYLQSFIASLQTCIKLVVYICTAHVRLPKDYDKLLWFFFSILWFIVVDDLQVLYRFPRHLNVSSRCLALEAPAFVVRCRAK